MLVGRKKTKIERESGLFEAVRSTAKLLACCVRLAAVAGLSIGGAALKKLQGYDVACIRTLSLIMTSAHSAQPARNVPTQTTGSELCTFDNTEGLLVAKSCAGNAFSLSCLPRLEKET